MKCIAGGNCAYKFEGHCILKNGACYFQSCVKETGKYEKIAQEIGRVVDEKNRQYGDAINNTEPILKALYPNGIKPEQYNNASVIIRVIDKLYRISKGDQGEESAWNDIVGYGLLRSLKEENK